jgi:hypothetical protein
MADEQTVVPELSIREKRMADRLARLAKAQGPSGVRVVPRDDEVRASIKHQPSEIGFPETGSVEWPNDAFTQRRIADGSVTIESTPVSETPPRTSSRGAASGGTN